MTPFEKLLLALVLKLENHLATSGTNCPECNNYLYTGFDSNGKQIAEGHTDDCLLGALTKDDSQF